LAVDGVIISEKFNEFLIQIAIPPLSPMGRTVLSLDDVAWNGWLIFTSDVCFPLQEYDPQSTLEEGVK